MANKKTTEAKTTIVNTDIPASVSLETVNDISELAPRKVEKKIPSELWHCVEDATGIGTLVMNLPSGCLIMTVIDQKQSAIQYVPGIRYDEASKRFSV